MGSSPNSTSVVLPTYNRRETLPRAINSALNQTTDDIEVIVVDDGSTDGTRELIESNYTDDIEYIRYGENSGANFARTVGALVANGTYISFLDSDDELHPQHVETVNRVLRDAPKEYVGVITSNTVRSTEQEWIRRIEDEEITSDAILDGTLLNGYSSLTVRSDILREFLPLDTKLPSAQEDDLYIRLAAEGYNLKGVTTSLVTYHKGTDQIIEDVDRRIRGQERILQKHQSKFSDRYRTEIYYNLGFLYYKNGNMKACKESLSNAVRHDPSLKHWYHYLASMMGKAGFKFSIKLKNKLSSLLS